MVGFPDVPYVWGFLVILFLKEHTQHTYNTYKSFTCTYVHNVSVQIRQHSVSISLVKISTIFSSTRSGKPGKDEH